MFPLAVCQDAFDWQSYGSEVNINLSTQPDPNDNCGWTTFFSTGGGSNLVFRYAKYYAGEPGGTPSPNIAAGHMIKLINGNISANLWNWMANKASQPGGFSIIIPVIETVKLVQRDKVLGFANYVVTSVEAVGQEGHTLHGYFQYIENVDAEEAQGQLGLFGITIGTASLLP